MFVFLCITRIEEINTRDGVSPLTGPPSAEQASDLGRLRQPGILRGARGVRDAAECLIGGRSWTTGLPTVNDSVRSSILSGGF